MPDEVTRGNPDHQVGGIGGKAAGHLDQLGSGVQTVLEVQTDPVEAGSSQSGHRQAGVVAPDATTVGANPVMA